MSNWFARVTQREPESRETWKATDSAAAEEFKQSPFSQWEFGAGEVIKASTKIVKVRHCACFLLVSGVELI